MCILCHTRSCQQTEAVLGVLMLIAFGLVFVSIMAVVIKHYFPRYRCEGRST